MRSDARCFNQPTSAFGFESEDAIKKSTTGAMCTAVAAQLDHRLPLLIGIESTHFATELKRIPRHAGC